MQSHHEGYATNFVISYSTIEEIPYIKKPILGDEVFEKLTIHFLQNFDFKSSWSYTSTPSNYFKA
jgi:hypothetical protein